MNTRNLTIALAAFAALSTLGTSAVADSIYKWTDSEGNVHYEDRPSGDPSEELLQLSFNRTNGGGVQDRVRSQVDAQTARREAAAAKAEDAAKQAAEAEQRDKQCKTFRGKLETIIQSARLYRKDENGERVYLDDNERQESRQHAENLVQEYCNP